MYAVIAFNGQFDDQVVDIVYQVSVVAGAALQQVGAQAAVEQVVAPHAAQFIVEGSADQHVVGAVADGQVAHRARWR